MPLKRRTHTLAVPPPLPVSRWPAQICALDIETAKTSFKNPESCEIACIGILPYKRAGFYWRQGPYQWFGSDQFSQLSDFLQQFPGIIIGHNVFDFDFRVLRPHISLSGIIEKTVDLRLLLQAVDRTHRARLSLDSLAWLNLRRRKVYNSRVLPTMWRQGERRKVLAHNKRDCELTAELWRHLLLRREVRTDTSFGRHPDEFHYALDARGMTILAGNSPQLTHDVWLQRIADWGNAVRPPNFNGKTYVEEPDAGRRPLFHKLLCLSCRRAFVLIARRLRRFSPDETIVCPFCSASVPVKDLVTLAWGYSPMATSVRPGSCIFIRYREPSRERAAAFPDPTSARKWIEGLRIWEW